MLPSRGAVAAALAHGSCSTSMAGGRHLTSRRQLQPLAAAACGASSGSDAHRTGGDDSSIAAAAAAAAQQPLGATEQQAASAAGGSISSRRQRPQRSRPRCTGRLCGTTVLLLVLVAACSLAMSEMR